MQLTKTHIARKRKLTSVSVSYSLSLFVEVLNVAPNDGQEENKGARKRGIDSTPHVVGILPGCKATHMSLTVKVSYVTKTSGSCTEAGADEKRDQIPDAGATATRGWIAVTL